MSNFINSIITIILVFILLVLAPLLISFKESEMISKREILNEVTAFIDEVKDKTVVTKDDVDKLYIKCNSHRMAVNVTVKRLIRTEVPNPFYIDPVEDNMAKNASFENGIEPWRFYTNPIVKGKALSGEMSAKLTGDTYVPIVQSVQMTAGHKYYANCWVYSEAAVPSGEFDIYSVTPGLTELDFFQITGNIPSNKWVNISGVASANMTVQADFRICTTSVYTMYADDLFLIDLTEKFGAGNEPSKEEMDEMYKAGGANKTNTVYYSIDDFTTKQQFNYGDIIQVEIKEIGISTARRFMYSILKVDEGAFEFTLAGEVA